MFCGVLTPIFVVSLSSFGFLGVFWGSGGVNGLALLPLYHYYRCLISGAISALLSSLVSFVAVASLPAVFANWISSRLTECRSPLFCTRWESADIVAKITRVLHFSLPPFTSIEWAHITLILVVYGEFTLRSFLVTSRMRFALSMGGTVLHSLFGGPLPTFDVMPHLFSLLPPNGRICCCHIPFFTIVEGVFTRICAQLSLHLTWSLVT